SAITCILPANFRANADPAGPRPIIATSKCSIFSLTFITMAKDYCLKVKSLGSMMAGPVLYQDRAMKQITFAPRNHLLTNTNTWPPDSQWLVFDVRPPGAPFTGEPIGRLT